MPNEEKNKFFWTDEVQAQERLNNTFIKHNDDVVFVSHIENEKIFYINYVDDTIGNDTLDSVSWKRFRVLPPIGWLNIDRQKDVHRGVKKYVGGVYLNRRAVRSRSHGLNDTNIQIFSFQPDEKGLVNDKSFILKDVYKCGFYKDPEQYPSFTEAFRHLRNGFCVALSPKFALIKDSDGLTWLYRKRLKVALIPNVATLFLLASCKYYREDILENHHILPLELKEL